MDYVLAPHQDAVNLLVDGGTFRISSETNDGPQRIAIHISNIPGFIRALQLALRQESFGDEAIPVDD